MQGTKGDGVKTYAGAVNNVRNDDCFHSFFK
jgi:hypothetical protein